MGAPEYEQFPGLRVMVVDDSSFARKAIVRMLRSDPLIDVVGEASDGLEAIQKAKLLSPDVITLDLRLPEMDGVATLRRLMVEHPTPVVILSSLAQCDAALTLEALEAGAVDFVDKTSVRRIDIHDLADVLCRKVRGAHQSRLARVSPAAVRGRAEPSTGAPPRSAPAKVAAALRRSAPRPRVVVLGASTGGPPAIQAIVSRLPDSFPVPILVVQHMPAPFVGPFAKRLDGQCRLSVSEARAGDLVVPGRVLLAPGGLEFRVVRAGQDVRINLRPGRGDAPHIPSVDNLLESLVEHFGAGICAVILTGMGRDGLVGARAVRAAGGMVLAQSEDTCIVYGMPRAVVEAALTAGVVHIEDMAETLLQVAS
jgi:two-component system chemotaxis response regulator CheB